jgi:hypothetical protein
MKRELWIKAIMVTLIAALTAVGLLIVHSKRGECSWCPSFSCYDSTICGSGCLCISQPGEVMGHCYGVKRGN